MFEKTKKFIKKHKIAVTVGSITLATGLLGCIAASKKNSDGAAVSTETMPTRKKMSIPQELEELGFSDPEVYDSSFEIATWSGEALTVGELAKLSDALKGIPGVTDDSHVWALLNVDFMDAE